MKKLILYFAIVFLGTSQPVWAATAPDQLVRTTTNEILALLKKNHLVYKKDDKKLYGMVHKHILPHFDFSAMSRLVLARHWRQANEDQRNRFRDAFRDLLVRTYATALLKYRDEKVLFLPYHAKPEDKRVLVKTEVVQAGGGANIPLNYKFFRKNSDWKVYDVSIDGVSLVTNYRSVYAEKIRKEGIDALIVSITKDEPKQS